MEITEKTAAELLNKYGDMLYRVAYSYTKSKEDAEDVTQDVFIKLIERNEPFESDEHEKAWLIRVTVNACKNMLGFFGRKSSCSVDEIPEQGRDDSYASDNFVLEAVMSLPTAYRLVIYLYYYEEYKTPEIARILKKREASVRSDLHRARQKLKAVLKEDYDLERI